MDAVQVSNARSAPVKTIGDKQIAISYTERSAVGVVVKSTDNRVAIIKVRKGNYYKLPGGGVETDENHLTAAEREVAEETGARVSIHALCVAKTEEYRNDLHQISYCYRADLVDGTGKPSLTDDEIADGLTHEWLHENEALEAMSSVEPASQLGRYIKERDTFLLQEALKSDV